MKKVVIDEAFLSQLEQIETVLKNNVAGMFGGNRQTKNFGSSCEFADYRDYLPGGDVNKIDWNAYGRMNRLFVKLFQEEKEGNYRIYIDGSKSMDYGSSNKSIFARRIAKIKRTGKICRKQRKLRESKRVCNKALSNIPNI